MSQPQNRYQESFCSVVRLFCINNLPLLSPFVIPLVPFSSLATFSSFVTFSPFVTLRKSFKKSWGSHRVRCLVKSSPVGCIRCYAIIHCFCQHDGISVKCSRVHGSIKSSHMHDSIVQPYAARISSFSRQLRKNLYFVKCHITTHCISECNVRARSDPK